MQIWMYGRTGRTEWIIYLTKMEISNVKCRYVYECADGQRQVYFSLVSVPVTLHEVKWKYQCLKNVRMYECHGWTGASFSYFDGQTQTETQIRSENNTLNVTDAQFKNKHAVLITLRWSVCNAMQCNAMQYNTMQYNAMQYNAMQCNTMQCNAMQCNAMYESVRPYGMKSVSHFFFFFHF
jgi:hypothetical protein